MSLQSPTEPHVEAARDARLLIDGQLVDGASGRRFQKINPATEEPLGEFADATRQDLDTALAAARRAFDETSWRDDHAFRARCLRQLQEAMRAHVDELRHAVVSELGAPIWLVRAVHVDAVIEKVGFLAEMAERAGSVEDLPDTVTGSTRNVRSIVREPVGVVGAITPWNIPVDIPMAKCGGALAAGNTVVLKPAPDTPWSIGIIARLVAEETDIPPGVLNIVTSSDHSLGAALTADPRVDAVSFTGSTATGRKVMAAAAEGIKRVHLELGGKSPNIVLDDVDFEQTVPRAAAMATFNAGQSCILPSRLLVPADRFDECVELAAAGLSAVRVGDPTDPETQMGPLISATHLDRVLGMVRDGLRHGGRVVVGGGRHPDVDRGYYVQPTLIVDVAEDHPLVQQEIFGPVLVVQPYTDEDDAVRIANGTPYGLAAYVWSGSVERAEALSRRLRAGMVGINGGDFTGGDMPFGGVGASGIGREWGAAGVEEFQEIKTLSRGYAA